MPGVSRSTPETTNRLTAPEERVARGIIAAHRARLDWLLHVPQWEDLLASGLVALGLPGPRQGIGFHGAVGALALENKHQLVRWTMQRFRFHLPRATGQRLCRVVGVDSFSELELDEMLTASQWEDLAARALLRIGHEHLRYKHAQQLLFVGYQHLVAHVVARSVFDPMHKADCIQEGSLGLLHAIDRSDDSNESLAAFAACWIRRAVRNYLMRQRLPVYAPVNLISKAVRRGETPDGRRGPEKLEMQLLECLRHPAVSLDEPADAEGTATIGEMVDAGLETPAEIAARSDLRQILAGLLASLTSKQRDVLVQRFGLGAGKACTLPEIAGKAGISHQQVCMREKRALARLGSAVLPLALELQGAV